MSSPILLTVINDGLWLLVLVGWVFLIGIGLEADKPLSGGLPGHAHAEETSSTTESLGDRVGEIGAWVTFGLVVATLPLVLWWIF